MRLDELQSVEVTTRLMVVAQYMAVRAGLHSLLARLPGMHVLGETSGSAELSRVLPDIRPEVLVVDDNPADRAAILEVAVNGEVGIVLLSDDRESLKELRTAGLRGWGCLLKDADAMEIAAAVRGVAVGLVVLDNTLIFASDERSLVNPRVSPSDLPGVALTARESQVLQFMAEGLPNKNIAVRLGISQHTVKFHVASVLAKLNSGSRTEAVTQGARRGLVTL